MSEINNTDNSHSKFINKGLNDEQVKKSLELNGINRLTGTKKKSFFVKFLMQFLDPMIILLVIATIISVVVSVTGTGSLGETHSKVDQIVEYVEPAVIAAIVLINAFFGAFQEQKAEKAMEALQKITSPMCKVIRNGLLKKIPSDQVVVGDLLVLDAGDSIVADAKIIEQSSLKCEESILTGESLPSEKDENFISDENTPLGDRKNYVFSGTNVVNGRAKAIVTFVGMKTEIGKIATLINDTDNNASPLQKRLHKLSKILGIFAVVVAIISFLIYILYVNDVGNIGESWSSGLKIAISLAIAAIPEGLIAIVTVVLALGIKRMVKQNALIKKLPSVETLGSTSVICSDKTGTLTQNKMTVVKAFFKDNFLDDLKNVNASKLIEYGVLCNDSQISDGKFVGDPTETSMFEFAIKNDYNVDKILEDYPRIEELPFDSDRKLMSTIHKVKDGYLIVTKGAPDQLMKVCKTNSKLDKAIEANNEMGNQALRVIAFGIKKITKLPKPLTFKAIESDLEFIGLYGIIDPPREEVKVAIQNCINAGIRPIMITGDHANTASAIARELGILSGDQQVITGAELSAMSDEDLNKNIKLYSVYARVSPENKIRIVKAWQALNQVVAMTGDGVNDAPALKAADIGCAMGITGTDVSKGAADMILTDDNFATIVEAVKEGRGILDNIKRIILTLLTTNFSELFNLLFGMLIFKFNPFSALQILWVNLVTESFPGVALGLKKPEKEIMNSKPLPLDRNILDGRMIFKIMIQAVMFASLSLLAFYLGASSFVNFDFNLTHKILGNYSIFGPNSIEKEFAANMQMAGSALAFIVLSISQALNGFNLFSRHSIFSHKFVDLKPMMIATSISFIAIFFVAFIPEVNTVFNSNVFVFSNFAMDPDIPQTFILSNSSIGLYGNFDKNVIGQYQYLLGIAFLFAFLPTFIFEMSKLIYNAKWFKKLVLANTILTKMFIAI